MLIVAIVCVWIVVMTTAVRLVDKSHLLGRNVDGGYLALAWSTGVATVVCFGIASAFGRPRHMLARMLTETVRQPPSPDAMRSIGARLQVAAEVLFSVALGLALTGWRVPPAGTVLISIGIPLLIAIAVRDHRQRKPAAPASAADPPRPVVWLPTQEDSQGRGGLVLLMVAGFLLSIGQAVFGTGPPTPYIAIGVMFLWIAIWVHALDQRSRRVRPAVESSEPLA